MIGDQDNREILLQEYGQRTRAFGIAPVPTKDQNNQFIHQAATNYNSWFGISEQKAKQGLFPSPSFQDKARGVTIAYALPLPISLKVEHIGTDVSDSCSKENGAYHFTAEGGSHTNLAHLTFAHIKYTPETDLDDMLEMTMNLVRPNIHLLKPALMTFGRWMMSNDTVVFAGLPSRIGAMQVGNLRDDRPQFDDGFYHNFATLQRASDVNLPSLESAHISVARFTHDYDETKYWEVAYMLGEANRLEESTPIHGTFGTILVGAYANTTSGFVFRHSTIDIPVPKVEDQVQEEFL